MPEPALVLWILGFPFFVAAVELARTLTALRRTPVSAAGGGAWSRATHARP